MTGSRRDALNWPFRSMPVVAVADPDDDETEAHVVPWSGDGQWRPGGVRGADGLSAQRRAAGEGMGTAVGAGDYAITIGEAFVWKSDRAEVTLTLASDGWIVQYSTVGRLLGPPQVLHQARHKDAKLATWDVMARVQNASNNEAEMVRAGHSAVRWIKSRPRWSELNGTAQAPRGTR